MFGLLTIGGCVEGDLQGLFAQRIRCAKKFAFPMSKDNEVHYNNN